RRRRLLARVVHRGELVEAGVGDFGDPDRRFALAVRGAARFLDAGHELEEGGLAAGTEADERCPEHVGWSSYTAPGVRRVSDPSGPWSDHGSVSGRLNSEILA